DGVDRAPEERVRLLPAGLVADERPAVGIHLERHVRRVVGDRPAPGVGGGGDGGEEGAEERDEDEQTRQLRPLSTAVESDELLSLSASPRRCLTARGCERRS